MEDNKRATATILTISLKKILHHYGESIVELRAGGGSLGSNKIVIDNDYGISIDNPGSLFMGMSYKQMRDEKGNILNSLNDGKIEEICKDIDDRFEPYYDEKKERTYPPDLPVEYFIISVYDKELQKLAQSNTADFEIEFHSDIVENPYLKEKIKNRNDNLGLFKQGFKFRSLNMHELLETQEKYGQVTKEYIVQWNGVFDIHPQAPSKIAQHIVKNYTPHGFGEFNWLKTEGMNKTVLTPMEA